MYYLHYTDNNCHVITIVSHDNHPTVATNTHQRVSCIITYQIGHSFPSEELLLQFFHLSVRPVCKTVTNISTSCYCTV